MAETETHMSAADELRAFVHESILDSVLGPALMQPVDEYPLPGATNVAALASIVLQPQYNGTERVTAVVVVLPAGGGILTLGVRVFALPAGVTVLSNIAMELAPNDVRSLQVTAGGQAFLEIMGYALPGTGAGVVHTGR